MSDNVKPNQYTIKTLQDLFYIATPENVDNLLLDVFESVHMYVNALKEIKENNPEVKDVPNKELVQLEDFIWIDDNKNDIDFQIRLKEDI